MLLFATLVSVTSSAEWKDASGEPSEKMVTAEAEADGFVLGTERSFNLEPRLFGLLEYSILEPRPFGSRCSWSSCSWATEVHSEAL